MKYKILMRELIFCISFFNRKLIFITFVICACLQAEYKNIVFDIGGVILSGGPKYYIQQYMPHMSGVFASDVWKDWDRGLLNQDDVIDRLATNYVPADIAALFAVVLAPDRPFIQETVALIQQLKKQNYRLYILSNFSYEAYSVFVCKRRLFDLFDGMVFSWDNGLLKPEMAIYNALLARFNLQPEETIFIDDQEENVIAATQVGIQAILYKPGSLADRLAELGVALT